MLLNKIMRKRKKPETFCLRFRVMCKDASQLQSRAAERPLRERSVLNRREAKRVRAQPA